MARGGSAARSAGGTRARGPISCRNGSRKNGRQHLPRAGPDACGNKQRGFFRREARAAIGRGGGAHLEKGGGDRGARVRLRGEHLPRPGGEGVGVMSPVEPSLVPVITRSGGGAWARVASVTGSDGAMARRASRGGDPSAREARESSKRVGFKSRGGMSEGGRRWEHAQELVVGGTLARRHLLRLGGGSLRGLLGGGGGLDHLERLSRVDVAAAGARLDRGGSLGLGALGGALGGGRARGRRVRRPRLGGRNAGLLGAVGRVVRLRGGGDVATRGLRELDVEVLCTRRENG